MVMWKSLRTDTVAKLLMRWVKKRAATSRPAATTNRPPPPPPRRPNG